MSPTHRPLTLAALALAIACTFGSSAALADNFTYHGTLEQAGAPASGSYDLKLTLYSTEHGGQVLAGPIQAYGVDVNEGSFSTNVDFGALANLDRTAWLGVEVKAGNGSYEALAGRSPIEPAASACPGSWTLDGNAGNPASAYLGAADATRVAVKTGGRTAAWFTPTGTSSPAVALSPNGSAVAGGVGSTAVSFSKGAAGDYSFAGGQGAQAKFDGSFVWGGTDTASAAVDSAKNQFVIGASGGVGIGLAPLAGGLAALSIGPRGTETRTQVALKTKAGKLGLWTTLDDGNVFFGPGDEVAAARLILGNSGGGVEVRKKMGVDRVAATNALEVNGNASKTTAGSWLANSDGRIKQDIQPIAGALDTLAKIRPVTFRYTDTYTSKHEGIVDQRYYNVIAQEFAEVFPDAVKGSGEYLDGADKTADNEILQVDTYPALITTVAAVQELAADNAVLRSENDELRAQFKRLSERMDQLAAKAGR